MTRATQILHAHHGSPSVEGCGPASVHRCYVCGSSSQRGQRVRDWMGENFTGQSLVAAPSSTLVCEPCVWAMAGRPPDTLRMWCHLYDETGYVRTNKGDKPLIREWLRRRHNGEWFASIADSGKKHVVPFTPVNPGGSRGRIRFEEDELSLPRDDDGWLLIDDATELLTLGATKGEIEPGEYGSRAWGLCPEAIRDFEDRWSGLRNSAWFRLAVWLAQRDEDRVAVRMDAEAEKKGRKKNEARKTDGGEAPHVDHGVRARGAPCVPEGVRTDGGQEALGPPSNSDEGSHENGGRPGGVGNVRDTSAQTTKPHQLGLPGVA